MIPPSSQALERRVAELEAEASRYKALLHAVPDLIVRLGVDGTYRDFVQAKNMAVVASREERLGRNVRELLPAEVADAWLAAARDAVSGHATRAFEYALRIGDRTGHYEARAVRSGDDEAIFVVRDVTERHQSEAALRREKETSERLLLNVLPRPIADRLRTDPGAIAERFDSATILFADIVGFTELSAQRSATEIVHLLNELFSRFDRAADALGLEKIKTIGDAYMAVGGLPTPRPDHARAVVELGLSMLDIVREASAQVGQPFDVRVGVNTGTVVAGVIGVRKFIYDLWGDAVNVASRMESHGAPGTIQISDGTRALLGSDFLLESRGVIPVKGKGTMHTWWVRGRAAPA